MHWWVEGKTKWPCQGCFKQLACNVQVNEGLFGNFTTAVAVILPLIFFYSSFLVVFVSSFISFPRFFFSFLLLASSL
jgi:hypothetical protein